MPLVCDYVDNLSESRGLSILIVGDSGTGKTSLIKSIADRAAVICVEPGWRPLKGTGVTLWASDNRERLSTLETRAAIKACADDQDRDVVVLDTITAAGDVALEEAENGTTKGGNKRHGLELYGDVHAILRGLLRELFALTVLGKIVIVLSQQSWERDEDRQTSRFMPSVPGQKFGPKLPEMFDEVYVLLTKQDPKNPKGRALRYLQTDTTHTHIAKSREGLEPQEPADLAAIFQKIGK